MSLPSWEVVQQPLQGRCCRQHCPRALSLCLSQGWTVPSDSRRGARGPACQGRLGDTARPAPDSSSTLRLVPEVAGQQTRPLSLPLCPVGIRSWVSSPHLSYSWASCPPRPETLPGGRAPHPCSAQPHCTLHPGARGRAVTSTLGSCPSLCLCVSLNTPPCDADLGLRTITPTPDWSPALP